MGVVSWVLVMEVDVSREILVFTLLKRVSRGVWARYRGMFQSLRYSFPIVVVNRKSKGRVNRKIVVFLKRHEHIWINMYKLLGWEVAERYEMGLHEFEEMLEDITRVLEVLKQTEVLKRVENFPPWLAEGFKLTVCLTMLSYDEALKFLETIRGKFKEYMEIPLSMKAPRKGETRLHKFLRTSTIATLIIRGTYKEGMLRYINDYLYELLSDGVVPVDYSYDSIIVAKKIYRHKGSERIWRSTLNLDPIEVLRGFESVYFAYVFDVKELEFEKRDVGWGLKAIPAF